VRLIIRCIFYIIVVRSYNSLLEMPVLENCLNFSYSPCLSHWTAVRSSSEEISVTFTRIYHTVFGSFLVEVVTHYLRIHVGETLENSHGSVFRNSRLISFENYCFVGIKLATPGKV